ncbi:MAG: hypothetical protein A2144_03595 [Chloroflexi bacterium RBG_16_50_9]|nr:MAG: hypothetical protein A2144_03595 [Chloroflexi bacterium RBG_16_50_9]
MNRSVSAGAGKRVILIINVISSFVSAFIMTAVPIALPAIGKEFSMEAVLMGWVVTAMTLSTAAILLTSGRAHLTSPEVLYSLVYTGQPDLKRL